MVDELKFHFLDFDAEIQKSYRRMPHWFQPGAATFITFRTKDSMPQQAYEIWEAKQREFLDCFGLNGLPVDSARTQLQGKCLQDFENFRSQEYLKLLDAGYGKCVLKDPKIAKIVAERLWYFDAVRYDLDRFVIMPNHVHLLLAFRLGFDMRTELNLLMRYTARLINEAIGSKGAFWQPEPFDHCIRSEQQFEATRLYIKNNPIKAGLKAGEYFYWQAPLSGN